MPFFYFTNWVERGNIPPSAEAAELLERLVELSSEILEDIHPNTIQAMKCLEILLRDDVVGRQADADKFKAQIDELEKEIEEHERNISDINTLTEDVEAVEID